MVTKTIFKTKDYTKVKFSLEADGAQSVELVGLNDNWEKSISLSRKKDGLFQAEINLPKNSTHEFKYLVDKTQWLNDENADGQVPNVFGGTNSVITL